MPGDDDPPNFMRWALSRYCYDHRGQVLPAMVDAMDRWPMELFEQVTGIGIEKSDLAAASEDVVSRGAGRGREAGRAQLDAWA